MSQQPMINDPARIAVLVGLAGPARSSALRTSRAPSRRLTPAPRQSRQQCAFGPPEVSHHLRFRIEHHRRPPRGGERRPPRAGIAGPSKGQPGGAHLVGQGLRRVTATHHRLRLRHVVEHERQVQPVRRAPFPAVHRRRPVQLVQPHRRRPLRRLPLRLRPGWLAHPPIAGDREEQLGGRCRRHQPPESGHDPNDVLVRHPPGQRFRQACLVQREIRRMLRRKQPRRLGAGGADDHRHAGGDGRGTRLPRSRVQDHAIHHRAVSRPRSRRTHHPNQSRQQRLLPATATAPPALSASHPPRPETSARAVSPRPAPGHPASSRSARSPCGTARGPAASPSAC